MNVLISKLQTILRSDFLTLTQFTRKLSQVIETLLSITRTVSTCTVINISNAVLGLLKLKNKTENILIESDLINGFQPRTTI